METDQEPLVPPLSTLTLDQLPRKFKDLECDWYDSASRSSLFPENKDVHSRCAFKTPGPKPNREVNNWQWWNTCTHWKCDLITACLRRAISADHGSTRGGSVCEQSEGWPDNHSLNDAMKPYWSSNGELSVVQKFLLKASRIVIPSSMRLEILDKIPEGHQGITERRERGKSSVWWPGISREIQDLMQQCRVCALQRDHKPEPLIKTPLPDRPWQVVATDLFELKASTALLL